MDALQKMLTVRAFKEIMMTYVPQPETLLQVTTLFFYATHFCMVPTAQPSAEAPYCTKGTFECQLEGLDELAIL